MSADTERAKTILLEFLSAMKEWENKFATLLKRESGGREAHGDKAKAELLSIYENYIATINPAAGRLLSLSAGYPPQFDPDGEKVISAESPSKRKVTIETLWIHPKVFSRTQQNRYTMVAKNGEWRLDKKELYDSVRNKWITRLIKAFPLSKRIGETLRRPARRNPLPASPMYSGRKGSLAPHLQNWDHNTMNR